MKKNPFPLADLVPFLPYLFFIGVPLLSFLAQFNNAAADSYLILLPAIPFAVQLVRPFKYADLLLGVITFVVSGYLVLAYASDLSKIVVYNARAISFIIGGLLFLCVSFTMSVRLFRNERRRQVMQAA